MLVLSVVPPPVEVEAMPVDEVKVKVTWRPVENVLLYQVTLRAPNDPNSQPSVYNVSGTTLEVGNIRPCSNYLISVSSFNKFLVLSEPTDHTYTTNSESAEPNQYVELSDNDLGQLFSLRPPFQTSRKRSSGVKMIQRLPPVVGVVM